MEGARPHSPPPAGGYFQQLRKPLMISQVELASTPLNRQQSLRALQISRASAHSSSTSATPIDIPSPQPTNPSSSSSSIGGDSAFSSTSDSTPDSNLGDSFKAPTLGESSSSSDAETSSSLDDTSRLGSETSSSSSGDEAADEAGDGAMEAAHALRSGGMTHGSAAHLASRSDGRTSSSRVMSLPGGRGASQRHPLSQLTNEREKYARILNAYNQRSSAGDPPPLAPRKTPTPSLTCTYVHMKGCILHVMDGWSPPAACLPEPCMSRASVLDSACVWS